jgi:hypothetical protein
LQFSFHAMEMSAAWSRNSLVCTGFEYANKVPFGDIRLFELIMAKTSRPQFRLNLQQPRIEVLIRILREPFAHFGDIDHGDDWRHG